MCRFFLFFLTKVSASELIFIRDRRNQVYCFIHYFFLFLSLWANKQVGCFELTNKNSKVLVELSKIQMVVKRTERPKSFFGSRFQKNNKNTFLRKAAKTSNSFLRRQQQHWTTPRMNPRLAEMLSNRWDQTIVEKQLLSCKQRGNLQNKWPLKSKTA